MNDLASLVRAVTVEAYDVPDKRGRLPERIEVEANFDIDSSGHLLINRCSLRLGPCRMTVELLPQAVPSGLRFIADLLANEAVRGRKKNTRKRINQTVLYRRQGVYFAGCKHYFQLRNLTIDHGAPTSKGGSGDISDL